jgi:hypothetical protein
MPPVTGVDDGTTGYAVYGSSRNGGYSLVGSSFLATSVYGSSGSGAGVVGTSYNGPGVLAVTLVRSHKHPIPQCPAYLRLRQAYKHRGLGPEETTRYSAMAQTW